MVNMPNGISCAYFATRNFIYGTKENNLFKEGIGLAQTIRTADAAAKAAAQATKNVAKTPLFAKLLSKGADKCCAILYPLIIASGVYNTVKSKDKVKTGISQAGGIGTMFAFEQTLAYIQKKAVPALIKKYGSKIPKNISNIVSKSSNFLNTNKYGKVLKYILQGILFATVSMGGYNTGSKIGEKIVDKYRQIHNITQPSVNTVPVVQKDNNIFEDIQL